MFNDNFHMALSSIRASRLRSFLTLLGVIIGVTGVITSIGLAEGIKNQVAAETDKLGNDVLTIRPGKSLSKNQQGLINGVNILGPGSTNSTLSEKDIATVRDSSGVMSSVPLNLSTGLPTVGSSSFNDAVIIGTTPGLPEIINQDIQFGRFFDNSESNKKVAVIGARVAEKLFGENVPLSQSFNIRGQTFIVEGVFERFKTPSLSQGIDFNNAIFIPYQSTKKFNNGIVQPYEILAKVNHIEQIDQTVDSIRGNLKRDRGGQEDFTILRGSDTQAVAGSVINLITAMAAGIAVITMVIGGMGIMNIMLVSVTERTREIGIRKAVGATNHQIRKQFMMEATILSIWGAFIGVIFAAVINALIRIFTNLQPVLSWQIVLLTTLASVVIGIIFGAAPAIKASRKDPIDALRYGM